MVYYRNSQSERPPLSCILPHLYLGAESDVTQDGLSDRGISYVLSVSRCCPQPSFLPQSQYLRIPIDDSLRDDLLPWIPQALHFIDGAMSLGCSVLVHCAAGISRSPALAVAYVMYSLKMDLDHAYRFVKERRPTISPNFNFLGQLQLFQGTLFLMNNNNTNLHSQESVKTLDNCLQPTNDKINSSSTVSLLTNLNLQNSMDNNCIINGRNEDSKVNVHCDNKNNQMENNQSQGQNYEVMKPEFTISLSGKLGALTLHTNPVEVQRPVNITSQTLQDAPKLNPPKPTFLQIPSGRISLAEKRKNLTLSLTPVSADPQTHQKGSTVNSNNLKQSTICSSTVTQMGESDSLGRVSRLSRKEASARHSCSRSHQKKSKLNHDNPTPSFSRAKEEQQRAKTYLSNHADNSSTSSQRQIQGPCGIATSPPELLEKEVTGGVEAVEGMDGNQSPLSPVSLTVNKILDWGERMLLGGLFGPRIKVGQAALPYRC
ncbi:probable dual specificity protein phosphatase DDB_G0281963 [Myxocyprinus asiaticus]|uniref:probable dual specificity protein phosphatase DDB_G0281963 n=1 Tax=Myxocyprinus asiaticus TaxID=70543 RepID=UPI002221B371|nr:probable dual specificity protein phosphatase DDB_G0281963 [Myxocyprinus asiaticus]XP_051572111.1 probable dual specificity protein phosphatase DDB_G0281963 [Myxocyprinus asiaticus]